MNHKETIAITNQTGEKMTGYSLTVKAQSSTIDLLAINLRKIADKLEEGHRTGIEDRETYWDVEEL